MNELQKLKSWFTLDEAARHITAAVNGEEVTVAELLQLALPGGRSGVMGKRHLTLSIDLVNPVKGKRGTLVTTANVEAQKKQMSQWGPVSSFTVDDEHVMVMDERVKDVDGLWDLAGWGGEDVALRNKLNKLLGAPLIEQTASGPQTWLCSGDHYVQLHEPFPADVVRPEGVGPYYPSTGLPEGPLLVVRQTELARFLAALAEGDAAPPASAAPANDNALAAQKGPAATLQTRVVHSTKAKKRDEADVIIDLALKAAGEDSDDATVWTELQRLVDSGNPPGTAIGMAKDGLRYTRNGTSKTLTRDAFVKRLKGRRKTP